VGLLFALAANGVARPITARTEACKNWGFHDVPFHPVVQIRTG